MNKIKKTTLIQLAGAVLCLVCALLGSFYYISSVNKNVEDISSETPEYLDNSSSESEKNEYDPLGDINKVVLPSEDKAENYEYYSSSKNYNMLSGLKEKGYTLSAESYDSANCKIGVVSVGDRFSSEFSVTDHKVEKPVTTEGQRGGYYTEYETVTEKQPLLTPYYGYVICNSGSSSKLMDSNLNVLMNYFSEYEPAYMTDNAGNPLFKKGDKYYFYYSGGNYSGAAYSEIDAEDFTKLSTNAPSAYGYFEYDRDMLQNYFATNKIEDAGMTGLVYYLPDHSGMVEYTVDPELLNDLRAPARNYNESNGELFPFPAYTYTKKEEKKVDENPYYSFEVSEILWGYMNAKGEVVIEPQYLKAYDFSDNGLAVVEDKHGHLCTINQWGSFVFNAYETIHYFPDLGNQRVRDGHYIPDTFGAENVGMLRFDNGYVRMRRRLVDTENGYIVRREMQELVGTDGVSINLPGDCMIEGYSDGIMLIKRGEKYGYMRTDGSWLIEPVLAYARPFSEGLAVMGYEKGKLGVIDTEGNMLIYRMYRYISDSSGGVITAYSEVGGWSVFYKMSTERDEKIPVDPIVELKKRAIAQAKYDFYIASKEAEEQKETEVPKESEAPKEKK